MRAVLDTNVLISGLLWRGIPHDCLLAAEAGMYELVLAQPVLDELHEKLVGKFRNTTDEADEIVAQLIVSGDRHLLDFGNVEGIPILSPHQFLDRLTSER